MMASENHELLLVTESSDQQWSVVAWDLRTGSSVRTFKGQAVAAGCLCLQSGHTLIGASAFKPVLQLWPLRKDVSQSQQKIVCPGKVSALAISPDGLFCTAGISDKVYIWEMNTGSLLSVLGGCDEVTVVRFTDDGSQFVTGSVDGMLMMWDFAHIVSRTEHSAKKPTPRKRVHAHSEKITDIHVGCCGPAARVASTSEDSSCKLWDMVTGELLRTLIYDGAPCSVIMDRQEMNLIVGLETGDIICSPLYCQISPPEEFVSSNSTKAGELVLQGHKGSVTCLALSRDGLRLASGSSEGQVKVWDLSQGCTHQVDRLMGSAVGNLMIIPAIKPGSTPVHQGPSITFKQQVVAEEGVRGRVVNVTIPDTTQFPVVDTTTDIGQLLRMSTVMDESKEDSEEPTDASEKIAALEKEVARLKQINKDLYSHFAKKIINK